MQFLEANTLVCSNLKSANQLLLRLSANIQSVLKFEYKFNKRQLIGMLINIGTCKSGSHCNYEAGLSACWVPFDIYMENALDGKQLPVTSAIDILAGEFWEVFVFILSSFIAFSFKISLIYQRLWYMLYLTWQPYCRDN